MEIWPPEFEDVLRRHCRFTTAGAAIAPNASLTELGMDSLQVVELIVDLEDCFEFCIPEPLLTPEVFAGPATIWKAIGPLVSVADS